MSVAPKLFLASLALAACAPSTQEGKSCWSAMDAAGINDPRAIAACVEVLENEQRTSPNEAAQDVMAELVHDGVLAETALNHERFVIVRHQFDKDALPLGMNKEGW